MPQMQQGGSSGVQLHAYQREKNLARNKVQAVPPISQPVNEPSIVLSGVKEPPYTVKPLSDKSPSEVGPLFGTGGLEKEGKDYSLTAMDEDPIKKKICTKKTTDGDIGRAQCSLKHFISSHLEFQVFGRCLASV